MVDGPCVCGTATPPGPAGTCCYEHSRRICWDCYSSLSPPLGEADWGDPCDIDWSKVVVLTVEAMVSGLRDIEADLR